MEWLKLFAIAVVLGRSIYTDMKKGIIENGTMLFGCIAAFGFAFWNEKVAGLIKSGRMLLLVFGILFLLYLVKGLGAGDVKLLCVLTAFIPEIALEVLAASFIVAAILSVGKMVVRKIQRKTMYIPGESMKFSMPVGIGTAIAMVQHYLV